MKVIEGRNVQQILPEALRYLKMNGLVEDSRNGRVLVAPGPVATVYRRPRERVIFWPERDANPFFHFMEALWMLAGREDVEFLTQFVPRMADYSDDGVTFWGAYGYRWRKHFSAWDALNCHDQLRSIGEALRRDPTCRRQVLTMWDPGHDLGHRAPRKDLPCNTHAYFLVRDGRLDMTVCCRSNDILWGCYGANAVHFSFLLEYMAARVGVRVGVYTQVSNNWHAYEDVMKRMKLDALHEEADRVLYGGLPHDPYEAYNWPERPSMVDLPPDAWDLELKSFLDNGGYQRGMRSKFLLEVADPLWETHRRHKAKEHDDALASCQDIRDDAWKLACEEWLERRKR